MFKHFYHKDMYNEIYSQINKCMYANIYTREALQKHVHDHLAKTEVL